LANGDDVWIFTTRMASENIEHREVAQRALQAWCLRNIGQVLPLTGEKRIAFDEMWDDRAVQVEPGAGQKICPECLTPIEIYEAKQAPTVQPAINTLTAMVIDTGIFSHFAEALATQYKTVLYHNPAWKRAFPLSRELYVGSDLPNIEVCPDFYDGKDRADVFIFPDGGHGGWQQDLVSQGKKVWGGRHADAMEQDRWAFKQDILKSLDMPVQPMVRIVGLGKLREYLKKHQGEVKYVKLSETRGDMESCRYEGDYESANEAWIKALDSELGPIADDTEFVVEDPIPTVVEMGGDHYNIDGAFPDPTLWGYELKDCGYLGAMVPYSELPEPILWANDKLAPIFKEYGYRGGYSSELRVTKEGKVFYLDPCLRFPSPPSQLYPLLIDNWGEITYYGAQGIMVNPKKKADYGVLAMIYAEKCDERWIKYDYPKALAENFRFSFSMIVNGGRWTSPQRCGMQAMGAVCAVDDNPTDAIKKLVEYSSKLSGHNFDIKLDAIPKGIAEIHVAARQGYKFGKAKVPSVADVANMII